MKIVAYCEKNSLLRTGEIELDESYFGAKRARGKTLVFGILKRDGNV